MSRITTTIAVAVILLNASATIMVASGLSEDLGVEIETGIDDRVDDIIAQTSGAFDPGTGVVESFVGLALSALDTLRLVPEMAFAAPTLLVNLLGGSALVEVVVFSMFGPAYLLASLDIIGAVLGNRVV
jgi:hypothetical protein